VPRLPTLARSARLPRTPPNTRRLEGRKALAGNSSTMGYHERRFGWQAGFWPMWDTDPSGSVNAIKRVGSQSARSAQKAQLSSSGWDRDPAQLQLVPASGTCGMDLRPHECWDNRGSASWRGTVNKENTLLLSQIPRPPRSAREVPPPAAFRAQPPSRPKKVHFVQPTTKQLGAGGHYVEK
jgi:hypothetical protein